jgi:hypothetical protein
MRRPRFSRALSGSGLGASSRPEDFARGISRHDSTSRSSSSRIFWYDSISRNNSSVFASPIRNIATCSLIAPAPLPISAAYGAGAQTPGRNTAGSRAAILLDDILSIVMTVKADICSWWFRLGAPQALRLAGSGALRR